MALYKFGGKIGSGGFGVVSHATRTDDETTKLAVKHLAEAMLSDEEAVKRFRREVRLQRDLEHPNILPVIGANLSATPPWFVMPYAPETLLEEAAGGLDDGEVRRLFPAILEGLGFAHAHSVIHR